MYFNPKALSENSHREVFDAVAQGVIVTFRQECILIRQRINASPAYTRMTFILPYCFRPIPAPNTFSSARLFNQYI